MDVILNFLYYFGLLILGLSILVVIHELGHFLPAKWFGMRVEKFYLFFDYPRKIWSFKKGDTEYGVGWLPLGGYVKISGIIDESMDTKNAALLPQEWEFRAKPVWQRLIVMVGGVTMNVILAVVIFWGIKYLDGETKIPMGSLKYGIDVPSGSLSEQMGFQAGDKILDVKGKKVEYFNELLVPSFLLDNDVYFTVLRGNETIRIMIPDDFINKLSNKKLGENIIFVPNGEAVVETAREGAGAKAGLKDKDKIIAIDSVQIGSFGEIRKQLKDKGNRDVNVTVLRGKETVNLSVKLDSSAKLGVGLDNTSMELVQVEYGLFASFWVGTKLAFSVVRDNLMGFKKLFSGNADTKSLSGPVGIAKIIGKAVERSGLYGFLVILATLSMVLAFMNILPIPALDGGHVVFLLIELVMRKEPSLKIRMVTQQVGMGILLLFMFFAVFNDIMNW